MDKRKVFWLLTGVLTIIFMTLAFTVFNSSYLRIGESITDLRRSAKYYFCEILALEHGKVVTVLDYSKVLKLNIRLPKLSDRFYDKLTAWYYLLFNKCNFTDYTDRISSVVVAITAVITIGLPIMVIFYILIKKTYTKENNRVGKETLPLKAFKMATGKIFVPIKKFISEYLSFVKGNNVVLKLWLILWLCNLNIITIIIEFIAYYLYFAVTLDVFNLYTQIYKLVVDLQVVIRFVPLPVWVVIGCVLFDRARKKRARKLLRRFEARNCGYINELPIVSMTCGTMGKKKTTMITDMALSQEVMFKQKAFELLQKNDMKFPFFNWILFEKELQRCMEHGTIYNLASVKTVMRIKRTRYERHKNTKWQLYGYDVDRYGVVYNNGLYEEGIFDVLETYAQLYFIYVVLSSFIVSNYSIRTDNKMIDIGNFPIWIMDFFPEQFRDVSRHSHILDFDVLRLGKKVIENNRYAGSFEFGVVAITEVGKERGNNLELKEVKKGTETANQKNDLFNSWLKMCRHSATVDNFPFIKVFTDEQRPESWGADARDLSEISNIEKSSEQRLALPFYTIEEMISEWCFNKFTGIYYDLRFRRGDTTLLMYILKKITAWQFNRTVRIYNRYGYSVLTIEKERGSMDGKIIKMKYYIINGKIYRKRFSTDCFSEYFNEKARESGTGINDYIEYVTEKASVEELKKQNSYFINSLYKDSDANSAS